MKAIKIYSTVHKISWTTFRLFGFVPGSSEKKKEKSLITWSFLLLAITSCIVATTFWFQEYILNQKPVGNINDSLKFTTRCIAYCIMIIESLYEMENSKLLSEKWKQLDEELKKLKINLRKYELEFLRTFSIRFIFFISLGIIIEAYLIVYADTKNFTLVNLFPGWGSRTSYMYYMHNTHLITSKLKIIQYEMLESFVMRSQESEKLVKRLQTLKTGHGKLWRITHEINEMFAWSITANLIQNFVQLGCDSYWFVIIYFEEPWDLSFLVMWAVVVIIPSLLLIVVILNDANEVQTESAKIAVILHSQRRSKNDLALHNMVWIAKNYFLDDEIPFSINFSRSFNSLCRSSVRKLNCVLKVFSVLIIDFSCRF